MEVIKLPRSDISVKVTYPEENPTNYIEDISSACSYIGLFDNLVEE